ncbi:ATP-binding sugar transporter from pro-phage [Desulfitobacterium hafniense]|uniref:ATP-binding sugar transporter from pro-phage n=1 Tax=Desulfitobacterium hafniense TaxID=49338 RepID=A0A098AYU8_DESHA|nr:hypothetical protein [Desulfitobacterium hafniense]CDX01295.1 ATP-binding sugar transporter from pro-phage [Desulfitobacterium hafniense]
MPKLRDYFSSDLDTFMNQEEFAELHKVDGVEMLSIVDADDTKEFSGRSLEMESVMQGIFVNAITLYVKIADYEKPNVGYRLNLDGDYYNVVGVSETSGLLKINLIAHES